MQQNELSKAPSFHYVFQCFDEHGELVWAREIDNLVTTPGSNNLLDVYFGPTVGYTAAWYLGLISSVGYTAIAVTDTMASHAGWNEAGGSSAPDYSAANRGTMAFSAAAAGSKTTSSTVNFTFTAGGTVKGGFITTGQVKDGTTGILYSAGLFTGGDAVVLSGYQLQVTATVTQT